MISSELNQLKSTEPPPPDLSTKPKDIIGYCFGFSCKNHHIGSTFESITVDGYKEERVCQTCGEIATPAIVKRIAEAQWVDLTERNEMDCIRWGKEYFPHYGWIRHYHMSIDPIWGKHEFVRFLTEDKQELITEMS